MTHSRIVVTCFMSSAVWSLVCKVRTKINSRSTTGTTQVEHYKTRLHDVVVGQHPREERLIHVHDRVQYEWQQVVGVLT